MAETEGGRWDSQPGTMRGVLPAGTSLRGYELIAILGQGAFGITYRARDLQLHREVAIKEYLPTSLALREGRTTVVPRSLEHAEQFAWGRERFLDEARTLARLDRTPAIVRVHDFLEDNGTAYMVMALIEGETLARRLAREHRLQPDAIERIVFALLDGLEEVHAIGFLHRDIKPANIMMDDHGRPTLIDFGASRAAMAERSTTLTAIFTPGYAAAEQFTSATLGPWSDIYGLAATLYHAITGRIPPSAIDRILNDTYEPLSTLQPEGFSPGLLAGIDAGLAIRVEDRPATIAEWRQMLRSDGYGAASSEATRVARRPGRLSRAAGRTRRARLTLKGPALWASIAAAIVLLAGGGYLAVNSFSAGGGPSIASLSAEQLEQALVERRKADALAAEKRRLEDEARQKAQAEAEHKRQADAELDQARQARLKAEQELAELKATIEARRQVEPNPRDIEVMAAQRAFEEAAEQKAEQEAAALRETEEEAAKKAAADAEAKRQADQVLAEAEAQRKRADAEAKARADTETTARAKASQEAQRKAEQETAARRQADEAQAKAQAEREQAETEAKVRAEAKAEADKAAAALDKLKEADETAERAARLEPADRQRLQVALTSLGFDTRGVDGLFGPRTREMIAAWQKSRQQPPTGFLTAAQQQAVAKEAAAALSRYDEQKKVEEARTRSLAALSSPGSGSLAGSTDGWWRGRYECGADGRSTPVNLSVDLRLSGGSGTWYPPSSGPANNQTRSIEIAVDGANVTAIHQRQAGHAPGHVPLTGRVDGNAIRASNASCTLALMRDGASMAAAASGSVDGTYTGSFQHGTVSMGISVTIANGRGTGTTTRPGCGGAAPVSLVVAPSGSVTGEATFQVEACNRIERPVAGRVDGQRLLLNVVLGAVADGQIVLTRGGPTLASAAKGLPDGAYGGGLQLGSLLLRIAVQLVNGVGSGTVSRPDCGASPISLRVDSTGNVTGEGSLPSGQSCARSSFSLAGRVEGSRLMLSAATAAGGGGNVRREFILSPGGAEAMDPPASAAQPPTALPQPSRSTPSAYDGTYSGEPSMGGGTGARAYLVFRVRNGMASGTVASPGCTTGTFTATITASGSVTGEGEMYCVLGSVGNGIAPGPFKVAGDYKTNRFELTLGGDRSGFRVVLRPGEPATSSIASPDAPRPGPYDGAYSGTSNTMGTSGSAARLNISFQVVNGRGTGAITAAGCNPSPISLTVSNAGAVTGEGVLNCVVGGTTGFTGRVAVHGDMRTRPVILELTSERGTRLSMMIAAGSATAPAPPSPDGLWRGTYSCDAGVGGSNAGPFAFNVEVRLLNGSGSVRPLDSSISLSSTLELRVKVEGSRVVVTRFFAGGGAGVSGKSGDLMGQFDGQVLRAEGREQGSGRRDCTLSLERA